jgi:hypothetical protein
MRTGQPICAAIWMADRDEKEVSDVASLGTTTGAKRRERGRATIGRRRTNPCRAASFLIVGRSLVIRWRFGAEGRDGGWLLDKSKDAEKNDAILVSRVAHSYSPCSTKVARLERPKTNESEEAVIEVAEIRGNVTTGAMRLDNAIAPSDQNAPCRWRRQTPWIQAQKIPFGM